MRSVVVPLVTWKHATGDEFRAKGMPLPELFDFVRRFVWASPDVSDSRRRSAARTAELARALPDHPAPDDVAAWVEALRRMFPSGNTVSLHHRTLGAVYRYGAVYGKSSGNPAAAVKLRRPDGDPRPILNIDAAWPELLAVCATSRERLFLGLMRFAGLRRGEALGVSHDDVNTFPATWKLEVVKQRKPNELFKTRPKTPSSCRELPVREPLRELLAPVLAEGEPVVRTGLGGGERARVPFLCPFRENDLTDLGERLRAVLPDAFPRGKKMWHALRDTFAVELRRKGKSRGEISEALGHSSEQVTSQHYLGAFGRAVHESTFAGLDPPAAARGPAPPGACPACGAESREATAATVAPRRRSKAGPPTVKQEVSRCGTPSRESKSKASSSASPACPPAKSSTTPSRPSSLTPSASGSRSQRALPGLAVGPVVTRRK